MKFISKTAGKHNFAPDRLPAIPTADETGIIFGGLHCMIRYHRSHMGQNQTFGCTVKAPFLTAGYLSLLARLSGDHAVQLELETTSRVGEVQFRHTVSVDYSGDNEPAIHRAAMARVGYRLPYHRDVNWLRDSDTKPRPATVGELILSHNYMADVLGHAHFPMPVNEEMNYIQQLGLPLSRHD